MKPAFEKVTNDPGCSWSWMIEHRALIPFEWHHHPEYELTLTTNSRGYRYVGDHIEAYGDNDLILVGPDLPHTWQSRCALDPTQLQSTRVVKFSHDWAVRLTGLFPELHRLTPLLAQAERGVRFDPTAVAEVRPAFEALMDLPPDRRLLALLDILRRLAGETPYEVLLPLPFRGQPLERDARLERVFDWLHEHYTQAVEVDALADMACVSVSAFHRLFRRSARVTPMAYVSRLRIGRACALLIEGRLKISAIAETVGYGSLAQFNKEFRRHKGMTPRDFAGGQGQRPDTPGLAA
ncbi:MAG: AraC family transcriptional regulator [Asticcacaulis sp.]